MQKIVAVYSILLVLFGEGEALTCNKCAETNFETMIEGGPLCNPAEETRTECPTDSPQVCVTLRITFTAKQEGVPEKVSYTSHNCVPGNNADLMAETCSKMKETYEGDFTGFSDYTCSLTTCSDHLCNEKKEDEEGEEDEEGRDCETEFCSAAQDPQLQVVLVAAAALFYGGFVF